MKLYRAFATVGGLTMVSRVLGFARDILIAGVLGTGAVADAFFVAFRFPNLFRRLFGEGAFNSAFVPLFAKKLEGEGKEAARAFAEQAMAWLVLVILALTVLAELAMPVLMYGLAPGFSATPEKFDLAVLLTRITMPYLLCMSLVALLSGVLELGRQVRGKLRRLHRPQSHDDGGHAGCAGHGPEERPAGRHHPGLGRVRRRPVAAVAADRRGAAQRPLAAARMAAAQRRHGPPGPARHPRRGCRRRHPDQHRHRHGRRLAAARRRLASLLCRPGLRASPRHRRHRHRRGAAARRVAAPARRRPRRRHGQPEPQPRVRHAAHRAGRGGARRGAGRDRQGPVRARRLHAGRHARHRLCARHLRARPAVVRDDQGVLARLLRPRGHGDADALCGDEPHRQHAGLDRAVLPVPPPRPDAAPRHRRRHHARRLAQCRPALRDAGEARPVRRRRAARARAAAHRRGEPRHGAGTLADRRHARRRGSASRAGSWRARARSPCWSVPASSSTPSPSWLSASSTCASCAGSCDAPDRPA